MEENPVPDLIGTAIDRGKASLKDALWKALAWLFLAISAGALLLMAAAFAFYGAALGLAEAFGGRLWLGYLVAGSAFLLLVCVAFLIQRLRSHRAKKILLRKTAESSDRIATVLDPRPWVREHPWQTTGLAALGGFAVGSRMEMPGSSEAPAEGGAGVEKSFLDQLIDAVLDILKNALTPLVATEVAKKISQYQEQE